jgi:pyridoxal 5'-phosphate synthase pdxT subunit
LRIGVLALQGAFIEHRHKLTSMGVDSFEIRQLKDLDQPMDGLILPGGESTTQGRLLIELGLFNPLKKKIVEGLPTLATCAGMILLATSITGQSNRHMGTLPIEVTRNYFGRQLGSFHRQVILDQQKLDLMFIRAPIVSRVDKDVNILLEVDGLTVAVQYRNQIGLSFHPELSKQSYFHQLLIHIIKQNIKPS